MRADRTPEVMRVAVGVLFIAVYAAMRWFVPLPGIESEALAPPMVSAVTLGAMPYISAALIVELVAWLVPSLRHLREGSTAGRAKLERAAIVLAIVLAVFQAYGLVGHLTAANAFALPGLQTQAIAVATLVAGSAASIVVARAAAARGVPAPMVPLFAVGSLMQLDLRPVPPPLAELTRPVGAGLVTLGLAALVIIGTRIRKSSWVPAAAGTIVPPNLMGLAWFLGLSFGGVALTSFVQSEVTALVTVGVAAALIAAVLHRPVRAATLLSAAGFVVAVTAADFAVVQSLGWQRAPWIAIVVIVWVADVVNATRDEGTPVVTTTRPRDAHAARELLEEKGIVASVQGLATSSLFQALGPYALATVSVAEADVARAEKQLAGRIVAQPPNAREHLVPVLGAAVLALAMCFAPRLLPAPADIRGDVALAIRPLADEATPFATLDESTLPKGGLVQTELAPVGQTATGVVRQVPVQFVRIVLQPHETVRSAAERVGPWLKDVATSTHTDLALGVVTSVNEKGESTVIALRTYALASEVVFSEKDVEQVQSMIDDQSGPQPRYYVQVRLRPDAAARFEEATGRLVKRRLAIVVDGMVESAPVVQSAIVGGVLSITLGSDASKASALTLAKRLGGR